MPFNLKQDLNPDQLQAVTYGPGPLLILAGAGSGKTRALTYRAAHLIKNQNTPPGSILLLTFTNKAAGEMQHRLQQLIDTTLPFAGTFHSFCAKFLRRQGHLIGISPGYLIYDDADQLDLIKHIVKDLDLSPSQYRPRSLLSQIGQAKNELLTVDQYKNLARGHFQEIVADVYDQYQHRLHQADALDFDDLLLATVRILQSSPSTLSHFQQQFQYILVDEYQDTNKAQYLIAQLLSKQHKNINVVGDASQSIYRWRGADYRNLDYLKSDFPNLTTIKLEQNYRSTQNILDAATAVITKNTSHPILKLWTDNRSGDPINLYQARDQNDEADYIIRSLASNNSSAVLYRTNAQSRAFEEALIRAGIPYILVGGVKFYQRKEIKDVLAYLRLLINPKDSVSRNRALKLGKRRLTAFQAYAKKADTKSTTTEELFDQVLKATKYMDKYDKNIEEDLARIENIKELRSVASQFDHLLDFLENVALVEDNTLAQQASLRDHPTQSANAQVTLMTIHSAKGLEFDQVFVVGLEEGLFPHSRSLLEPAELEEERRLCYVALTRARRHLHLTYAQDRLYFGGGGSGVASRFISEIPENLLQPVSGYNFSTLGFKTQQHKPSSLTTNSSLSIDDPILDRFLDDDIDIDTLLDS